MKAKIVLLVFSFVLTFGLSLNAQSVQKDKKILAGRDKTQAIKVGEIAPDFTLSDVSGKQITLSKAGTPVVLVFYRGYW